jgi:hypothetical protein
MERKLIIGLSVTCALLAALLGFFVFQLSHRPRFTPTKSTNPYIMFDTKTAQSCWSGPANGTSDTSNPSNLFAQFDDPEKLPFCKDLR